MSAKGRKNLKQDSEDTLLHKRIEFKLKPKFYPFV